MANAKLKMLIKRTPKLKKDYIKSNIIVFNNFIKTFKKQFIGPVNFGIKKGTITALLGSSGSGKSVIMNALMGATAKYSGEIYIRGQKRKTRNSFMQNMEIGYYTQMDFSLFDISSYSYLEQMSIIMGIRKKDARKTIEYWMKYFKLWEFKDKKLKDFSWGMKNRINLVLCFMKEPDLLVLDEPGANLDSIWRLKVKELMQAKNKEGRTILITVHNIDEIVDIIDEYIIINEGKLVFAGSKEQLNLYNKYKVVLAKEYDEKEFIDFLARNEVLTLKSDPKSKEMVIAVKSPKKVNIIFIYLLRKNIPLSTVTRIPINMESINKALKSYYQKEEAKAKGLPPAEDLFDKMIREAKELDDKEREEFAKLKINEANIEREWLLQQQQQFNPYSQFAPTGMDMPLPTNPTEPDPFATNNGNNNSDGNNNQGF